MSALNTEESLPVPTKVNHPKNLPKMNHTITTMDVNSTLADMSPSARFLSNISIGHSNTTAVSSMDNMTVFPSTENPMSASLQTFADRVVVAVFIFLISLTNITGNSLVVLAVVFSKKLRTSTNVFVVSLSVADLLAGLAAPMSSVGLLSAGDEWPWSTEVPCSIAGLLLYISSAASLFNLASIALNRLILIKRPMTLYRSIYTRRNLVINVAVNWLVPICAMSLPPLFGIGGWGYDEHSQCAAYSIMSHTARFYLQRVDGLGPFETARGFASVRWYPWIKGHETRFVAVAD